MADTVIEDGTERKGPGLAEIGAGTGAGAAGLGLTVAAANKWDPPVKKPAAKPVEEVKNATPAAEAAGIAEAAAETPQAAEAVVENAVEKSKNFFQKGVVGAKNFVWEKPGLVMKGGSNVFTKIAVIGVPIAAAVGTAAAVNSFRNREDSRREAALNSSDTGRGA